jgi:hypothetical protein
LISFDMDKARLAQQRLTEKAASDYFKTEAQEVAAGAASVKTVLDAFGALAKTDAKPAQPSSASFAISGISVVKTGDPIILAVTGTGLTGMTLVVPAEPRAKVDVTDPNLGIVIIPARAIAGLTQLVFQNDKKRALVALPTNILPPAAGKDK